MYKITDSFDSAVQRGTFDNITDALWEAQKCANYFLETQLVWLPDNEADGLVHYWYKVRPTDEAIFKHHKAVLNGWIHRPDENWQAYTLGADIPSSDGVELEYLEEVMESELQEVWNG